MKIQSEIYKLGVIKSRYFFASKKQLLHYGDCNIYAGRRPFCGCGLLHQLNYLDYNLANIIYPKYQDDEYLQFHGKRPIKKKSQEEIESLKLLEKIFGPIKTKYSFEELKMDYDDYKKILKAHFTKKLFPICFGELKKWLHNEVAKDH